jgi:hypothetical protein
MKDTAAGLASLGRGSDTMLVHMSPREVAGLQSLAMAHGGSLTTNPHTGLPEAGFLENILPTVLGFALTPFMGPIGAGLTVGGLQAARTGDLGKGVLAGLGAFAGGGLGDALANVGTQAAGAATAQNIATQNAADLAAGALPQEIFGGQGIAQVANPSVLGSQYLGDVSAGIQNLGQQFTASPTQALSTAGSALKDSYGGKLGATAAGIGALGALGGFDQPEMAGLPPEERSRARLSGPIQRPYDPTAPGGYYFTDRGVLTPNYSAANGGIVALKEGGAPELKDGGFVLPADVVSHLGNGDTDSGLRYAARRLGATPIKGDGDGMSDSIPTSIEGRHRARVAAGEAYIPPENVKRVGGAKKLYAMMDKVRQARTGSTKQGRQINPERFVPA